MYIASEKRYDTMPYNRLGTAAKLGKGIVTTVLAGASKAIISRPQKIQSLPPMNWC